MRQKIDCFLSAADSSLTKSLAAQLCDCKAVREIFYVDGMMSSSDVAAIAAKAHADYTLIVTRPTVMQMGQGAPERLLRAALETGAAMVYADRYEWKSSGTQAGGSGHDAGQLLPHPVIDYQPGAIRDDFDFGPLLFVRTSLLHKYAAECGGHDYQYAALYALRLSLSREGQLLHLPEYLYTEAVAPADSPKVLPTARKSKDAPGKAEKQFDYVNPRNREVQLEMEHAATAHLAAIGAKLDPAYRIDPDFYEQDFETEATVVIPVFNRAATIADAVKSALAQETTFPFNVIVVDNHSTDGTSDQLAALVSQHADRLHVVVPQRRDLGIGGCWNEAVNDPRCGRFAVQLDSDDLYSSPNTLQLVVNAFYKQRAAMVVGSYRICDFDLQTLPPGLIDHREWTDENGPNNALRINGLGAPRAFFTPLLRQVQFPNTSYGEDYALGLYFSRYYRIGRIYDELYLCRRWGGNSDSNLSQERLNRNNLYKDRLRTMEISARQQMVASTLRVPPSTSLDRFFDRQLELWPEVRRRYRDLSHVETRELPGETFTMEVQWNPARMVSTGAKLDDKSIAARPCFLCADNRPKQQMKHVVDSQYELLVNPFPILPMHFTLPTRRHTPQAVSLLYGEIHRLLTAYPQMTVLYNGPRCGASAPDHAHLQAVTTGCLPLQKSWPLLARSLSEVVKPDDRGNAIFLVDGYPAAAFLIRSYGQAADEQLFCRLYEALADPSAAEDSVPSAEPLMNIVAWRSGDAWLSVVLPRRKHRPDCYMAKDAQQFLISPGAIDMGGLLITPREEDFRRLTAEQAFAILREVTLTPAQVSDVVSRLQSPPVSHPSPLTSHLSPPTSHLQREPAVSVGILSRRRIDFTINAPYTAKGETIVGQQSVEFSEGGILWRGQQYRELVFTPVSPDATFSLHDVTIGVQFHWERQKTLTYNGMLRLVVESDQITAINELPVEQYLESVISSEMSATSSLEFLKAHAVISRSWLLKQMEHRRQAAEGGQNSFFSFVKKDDELIRWYDREDHTIFDVCADDHCQRYQGVVPQASLPQQAVRATRGQVLTWQGELCDARFSKCCGGRTEEFQYCWEDAPKPYLISFDDPYCNTDDPHILRQVLNDYDRETTDFYRWTVAYTREEISALVNAKLKMDLGDITALIPVERGKSGRIWKLRIVGTKGSFTIGKELEIRRTLSKTHLLSSAFDVECRPDGGFVLHGKGWGHGVGLCQIGAAVMGEQGRHYDEILLYYYRGAAIEQAYQ